MCPMHVIDATQIHVVCYYYCIQNKMMNTLSPQTYPSHWRSFELIPNSSTTSALIGDRKCAQTDIGSVSCVLGQVCRFKKNSIEIECGTQIEIWKVSRAMKGGEGKTIEFSLNTSSSSNIISVAGTISIFILFPPGYKACGRSSAVLYLGLTKFHTT